jgi:cell wall-associated NlpC family hydrolase
MKRQGANVKRLASDRKRFRKLIRDLAERKISERRFGERVLEIGKSFLGAPYRAGLLETKRTEHLVINLRAFDCVTFVETVVALARSVKLRQDSFGTFKRSLRKIRYREGRLQGYPSRLHYFSEWIYDNQKKRVVRDITAELGGRSRRKPLAFMTTHPDLYPRLRSKPVLRKMKTIERRISRRSHFFIPKKAVRRLEDRIREGDLIAVTTDLEGLDVLHVGFAARVRNRIHLLNASSAGGKVVLSTETLSRYLLQRRTRSGIMVARMEAVGLGKREVEGAKGRMVEEPENS